MRFFGLFFACMDSFLPECEPLLVLNFYNVPSILDNYFKFLCVSGQTFS
jgi:hypothetical protein